MRPHKRRRLGYAPTHDVRAGLEEALPWYEAQCATLDGEPVAERADAR